MGVSALAVHRDGWIVVGTSRGRVLRWLNGSWETLRAKRGAVADVWASPAGAIYMVVDGRCQRWANGTLTTLHVGVDEALTVWGSDDDDVWVGGCGSAVAHWNGGVWESFEPGGEAYVAFAGTRDDVFAAAECDPVAHWDGAVWTPLDEAELRGATTLSSGVALVGGEELWIGDRGQLVRHDIELPPAHEELQRVACGPSERLYLTCGTSVHSWLGGEAHLEFELADDDYCYTVAGNGHLVAAGTEREVLILQNDQWRPLELPGR